MRAFLPLLLLSIAVLAGCAGEPRDDDVGPPYSDLGDDRFTPTFEDASPDGATGLEFVAQLADAEGAPFPAGAGNWVQGDYVYGSALQYGFFVADVSDPTHPVVVFNTTEDSITHFARKAQVVSHEDGRLTLALATQTDGMHLWNVTDPRHPEFAARVELPGTTANHNVAIVPGLPLVFNNPSSGTGGTNHLVDVSDPYNPVIAGAFGTMGCHGTTFRGTWGDPDFRAYCAAIQSTEIWDLTALDLTQPEGLGIRLAGTVAFPAGNPIVGNPVFGFGPIRTLHHHAMANEAGNVLIIGDEWNGGGSPGACFGSEQGASTPFGALWFYDISDESNPTLQGWITPPTVSPTVPPSVNPGTVSPTNPGGIFGNVPNCTAHFGTIVPGEEKLVMAWYSAGVVLIDFSDPTQPRILDQYLADHINTWNARVHNGYVFTGDMGRGMDVLRLV